MLSDRRTMFVMDAQTMAAQFATLARPVPCTFPGCRSAFQGGRGLKIHQSMRGHQPPQDTVERGDGPLPVLRVRGPSSREIAEEQNLDQAETGTLAKEDHPTFLQYRREDEVPVRLADRILRLVQPVESATAEDEDDTVAFAATVSTFEAAFDESAHPRVPAGEAGGGQFGGEGGGGKADGKDSGGKKDEPHGSIEPKKEPHKGFLHRAKEKMVEAAKKAHEATRPIPGMPQVMIKGREAEFYEQARKAVAADRARKAAEAKAGK